MAREEDEDIVQNDEASRDETKSHGGLLDDDAEVSDDDDEPDSSDEDDDEDDEEAIQKVREGFIVDDDEDEENVTRGRKHRKRKRREETKSREPSKENDDDALDEDDLELLLENSGVRRPAPEESKPGKFKRLKRAQQQDDEEEGEAEGRDKPSDREDRSAAKSSAQRGGLTDMFSDDEGDEEDEIEEEARLSTSAARQSSAIPRDEANILDEFEDFIEDDEFSDEDEERKRQHEKQRAAQRAKRAGPRLDTSKLSSVDRESLQQLFEVFGNGAEYEWALEAQETEDDLNGDNAESIALDEVFEHAELKELMLTEEDNIIRIVDIPERYQKYRSNLNYAALEGSELTSEQQWIYKTISREKSANISSETEATFKESVYKVVEFISRDSYEVPFIWAHRRDFLLTTVDRVNPDGTTSSLVHKLLYEDDLWRIVQLDIEYHSLYEKRINIERLIDSLGLEDDDIVRDIKNLESMVAIQDLHDYISFTYSKEIEEDRKRKAEAEAAAAAEGDGDGEGDGEDDLDGETANSASKSSKKHSKYAVFERIKANVLYDAVKALGISAKEFGENVQDQSSKGFEVPYRIHATDDPLESPTDLLEKLCDDDEVLFKDPVNAIQAVRKTFAEEIFHNPKIRHEVRTTYKDFALISCAVTERGKLVIDNHSNYADLKYAINRSPSDLVSQPDLFLRMLEAEQQGLLVVKVETKDFKNWFQCIFNCLVSDGSSEISEQWNKERETILELAFKKLTSMVALNTKEDLRRECERLIAVEVRKHILDKVDQAPYTPVDFDKGTKPNVLAISFGKGEFESAVLGVFVKENGKVDEFFKSDCNPIRDRESEEKFAGQLKEFFERTLKGQVPDVIVVSGLNAVSKRLFDSVKNFVSNNSISVNIEDDDSGNRGVLIPVIWGQDETARLYQNSERAKLEFSDKPTVARYCVALARYVQSPLLEYISLGDDILSITFCENQKLISNDLIKEAIETVYVDIVNMVGVEINEAVRDPTIAKLLPYVGGLGPRKASGLIRNINGKLGGTLINRSDLIEHELTTANVFINCSSFLNIPFDESVPIRDSAIELLDATRIHPEDYDLARKMAADALDLDEEDMVHVEEQGGIIYQLVQDGASKVDELNLTAYGKELESKFGKKKYATLQSIKEELVNNFEELRSSFHILEVDEVFEMLTGETTKSFAKGVSVPVTINKVVKQHNPRHGGNYEDAPVRFAKVTTSTLISGNLEENYIPSGTSLNQGQVVQVTIVDVSYESFAADFSLLEDDLKRANLPRFYKDPAKWDFAAEEQDLQRELAKERAQLSKTRNIQHPLFHNFNHKQAEEFLAPQAIGDCVLRPSSKGPEYLTVTWKVHNNLFQHLSIHEVSHSGIKQYIVEKQTYDDLDQLIFQHIQAIAKHVDEMCRNPKFREGTLSEVNGWLESYTKANPKNSAYVFCFDHKAPGWFLLLFKVNVNTPITTWHVKTECDGYRLKGFSYPNMLRLCNGFKQTFKSYVKNMNDKSRGPSSRGPGGAPANGGHPVGTYGSYGF